MDRGGAFFLPQLQTLHTEHPWVGPGTLVQLGEAVILQGAQSVVLGWGRGTHAWHVATAEYSALELFPYWLWKKQKTQASRFRLLGTRQT